MKKKFSIVIAFFIAVFIMVGQYQNASAKTMEPMTNSQLFDHQGSLALDFAEKYKWW